MCTHVPHPIVQRCFSQVSAIAMVICLPLIRNNYDFKKHNATIDKWFSVEIRNYLCRQYVFKVHVVFVQCVWEICMRTFTNIHRKNPILFEVRHVLKVSPPC